MKFRYNKHFIFLSLITLFFIGLAGCKKDNCIYESTLIKLYKAYKNGEISECKHNGQTVYCAVLNAYDAGSNIYHKDGKLIGTCNFAW